MKKRLLQILVTSSILIAILAAAVIPVLGYNSRPSSTVSKTALIDTSTTWKYLVGDTDPSVGGSLLSWTLSDYDDSSWQEGSGIFGSKNGALSAVNGITPTFLLPLKPEGGGNNYKTYFFRTDFTIDDIDTLSALYFYIAADDGAAVYVNGNKILDTRSTTSDSTNLYYTAYTAQTAVIWFDSLELAEMVREGENTVAVEVHNQNATSSDILLQFTCNGYDRSGGYVTTFDNLFMNVGRNETERNLTWYTTSSVAGEVQWAKVSDMKGGAFPTEYSSAAATSAKAQNAPGEYTNKATMSALELDTEYVYRLKNGTKYSKLYYFTPNSAEDNFDFIVFGDPQIRQYSFDYSFTDVDAWEDTLKKANDNFDAELYLSLGDQINSSTYELEYDGLCSEWLTSKPVATTVGNHDLASGGTTYRDHFNPPNLTEYGVSSTSSDYYFTYGDVLFMVLNYYTSDLTQHAKLMKEAIEKNPDCTWRVALMHISPFSAGSHSNDSDVVKVRNELTEYYTEYGIDLVLGGHDHIYTRSYLMDGNEIAADQSGIDSESVLYLTTGSSGGKFYEKDKAHSGEGYEYVAYTYIDHNRTMLHFEVTDNALVLNTYTLHDMKVIDSYTLARSNTADLTEAIRVAKLTKEKAEESLPSSYLTKINAAITDAEELLANYDNATASEVYSVLELLKAETKSLEKEIELYNVVSEGAVSTGFDSSNPTVVHLNAGGSYAVTNTSLTEATAGTVLTWKSGGTFARKSPANPYVALILDGDVTITSVAMNYTNLVIDLNGYTLTLKKSSGNPVVLSDAASIEFRGEGEIIWGSGTYLIQGNHHNSAMTFNGSFTIKNALGTSAKTMLYSKGEIAVHGTLTIDESFNPSDISKAYLFYIQGSRSNGTDRDGVINIISATVNYNSPSGATMFYSQGISGEYGGKTYTSIPNVNIIDSRVNLRSPMVTNYWGSTTVSGKSDSGNTLTNPKNTNYLNIKSSYIYFDPYLDSATTSADVTLIYPKGYTTVTVKDSTLYATCGHVFATTSSGSITINAEGSTFYAGLTESEASKKAESIGHSNSSILKGVVLVPNASTKGVATFTNCTLKAKYRILDGGGEKSTTVSYLTFANNCNLVVDTAGGGAGSVIARASLVINGGFIDCGTGSICTKTLPYSKASGTGLLIKGAVTVINSPISSYASGGSYVKTVADYEALFETDSTVFDTMVSSNNITVENGTSFVKITYPGAISTRYCYKLVKNVVKDFAVMGSLTLYADFLYNVYVPAITELQSVTVGETVYDIASLEPVDIDGKSYYLLTKHVLLTKTTDLFNVSVSIKDADGTVISGSWSLGVVKYLEKLLSSDESEEAKALAKDILSYIRAAKVYQNADYNTAEIDALIGENYDSTAKPDTSTAPVKSTSGLSSARLELGTAPTFRFYLDGSYDASLYVFTLGDKVLETAEGSDKDGTYLSVSLYAFELIGTVEYTVVGTDVTGGYNLSAYLDFAKTLDDPALVALVERLWKYSESALIYKNS